MLLALTGRDVDGFLRKTKEDKDVREREREDGFLRRTREKGDVREREERRERREALIE